MNSPDVAPSLWNQDEPADRQQGERLVENTGFYIRKLVLTGPNVAPAELILKRGLNVVSGPTNTGKSFAFHLFDYVFGARQLRKTVPVARGYTNAWIEIETYMGSIHTIVRSLSHGAVRWYDIPFNAIVPGDFGLPIGKQHSAKDSLSKRLNAICGLRERFLRNNKKEKEPLSFRQLTKFFLIDEQRIITDRSPIVGLNTVENPSERSLFQFLLSGLDATRFPIDGDPAESRRKLVGRIEFLSELINALPAVEADVVSLRAQQREYLDSATRELSESVTEIARRIDAASERESSLRLDLRTIQGKLATNRELLQRFLVLRDSYQSDLARLEFIRSGASIYEALPSAECPLCGHTLQNSGSASALGLAVSPHPKIEVACEAEEHKIRVHLNGLEHAISTVEAEAIELRGQVDGRFADIDRIRDELSRELHPRHEELVSTFQHAAQLASEANSTLVASAQRTSLIEARFDLQIALTKLPKTRPTKARVSVDTSGLAQEIRGILEAWSFPELTGVEYDADVDDFIVAGQPRNSQGKGVRAIIYSAFVIALMRYSRVNGTGHPGVVLLDSPLTTYRRPDSATSELPVDPDHSEDVSTDMQTALFRNLTLYYADSPSVRQEQIIIFENKEPPATLVDRMNYIRFVGPRGAGRSGFVPLNSTIVTE